jgi:transposase-like protein
MSKKRTNYSSAFKTKLVLELLQNEQTLAEISSKHNILPQKTPSNLKLQKPMNAYQKTIKLNQNKKKAS